MSVSKGNVRFSQLLEADFSVDLHHDGNSFATYPQINIAASKQVVRFGVVLWIFYTCLHYIHQFTLRYLYFENDDGGRI